MAELRREKLAADPFSGCCPTVPIPPTPSSRSKDNLLVERPEFSIRFSRVCDRISTLRSLYGEGPIEIDNQAIGAHAAKVRMTACQMQRQEVTRRSNCERIPNITYIERVVISLYISAALRCAHYEVLEDAEGFYGSVPQLAGVWAQAPTLEECREELKSAVEDWLMFSLSRQYPVPALDGIRSVYP